MTDRAGVPDLTIVIVSFNTREVLERCLEAVCAGSPGLAREVIVVDNASTDGSAESAARRPGVRLIVNRENRGYAPACNQGLRAARGRMLLALNSDALPRGDALATLVRHLDQHPELAAAGPRLLNTDGSTQWVCARRAPRFLAALIGHTHLPLWIPALQPFTMRLYERSRYERAGEVDVLSGACLLVRREALERIGRLDERLLLNFDDVEWSMRARRLGCRLGYTPDAEVVHLGQASRAFDAESNALLTLHSIGAFCDLTWPRPGAALLKLALLSTIGLSLAKNVLLAPFAARRRGRVRHLLALAGSCLVMLARPGTGPREADAP